MPWIHSGKWEAWPFTSRLKEICAPAEISGHNLPFLNSWLFFPKLRPLQAGDEDFPRVRTRFLKRPGIMTFAFVTASAKSGRHHDFVRHGSANAGPPPGGPHSICRALARILPLVETPVGPNMDIAVHFPQIDVPGDGQRRDFTVRAAGSRPS